MQLETLKLLEDIRLGAERVQYFVLGRSLDDYRADVMLRSAVERQFEIVGEAVTLLRDRDLPTADRITGWRSIVAFRNQLIHRYWRIDEQVVWKIIAEDLPVLVHEVRQLLAEGDPSFTNPPAGKPQNSDPNAPQENP